MISRRVLAALRIPQVTRCRPVAISTVPLIRARQFSSPPLARPVSASPSKSTYQHLSMEVSASLFHVHRELSADEAWREYRKMSRFDAKDRINSDTGYWLMTCFGVDKKSQSSLLESQESIKRVKDVFNLLVEAGLAHRSHYAIMLSMYDLVKDSKRVLELIKEMKEAQASYQSKRLQSEEVDDNKMLMGTTAYTCWLNALGRLMRIDEVAKVFKEFEHVVREREKKDSEHSSVVGSSINHYDLIKLVHTSSTVGDIPRTEYYTWLFGEIMCQRDDPSYVKYKDSFADVGVSRCKNSYLRNFVLRAHLSRNSFASSSMQVLDNMIKDNIQLSPVTLELLIREAQRINNAKKARELLAQFIRMGIAPNNATITLLDMLMLPRDVVAILFPADGSSTEVAAAMTKYAYNRLLRNAVHAKDYTSALTVFHHMRKHYSKLDAFSYAIVVDALGQIGEVQEAEGIVSTMMAEGVRPTITVYEALVDGLVTTSRIEKGELANELMARAMLVPDMMLRPENGGITPSAAIFDTLIYACTSTNAADPVSTSGSAISWSDKALELYRKMALLKLQPSAYTKSIIESHENSLKSLSKLSANNAFSRTTADW